MKLKIALASLVLAAGLEDNGFRVVVEKRLPNFNPNFEYDESSNKTKVEQLHDHLYEMAQKIP